MSQSCYHNVSPHSLLHDLTTAVPPPIPGQIIGLNEAPGYFTGDFLSPLNVQSLSPLPKANLLSFTAICTHPSPVPSSILLYGKERDGGKGIWDLSVKRDGPGPPLVHQDSPSFGRPTLSSVPCEKNPNGEGGDACSGTFLGRLDCLQPAVIYRQ